MKSFFQSLPGRALLLLLGLSLFVFLFARVGVGPAFHEAKKVGWLFGVIFLLGGLAHALRALSWVRLLRMEAPAHGFLRMFRLWLAGEAISHLSFSWSGETFRVVAIRKQVSTGLGAVAIALNRFLYVLASLVVVLVGLVLALAVLDLSPGLRRGIVQAVLVLVAVLLLAYLALHKGASRRAPAADSSQPSSQPAASDSRLRRAWHSLQDNWQVVVSRRPVDFVFLFGLNLLAALVGVAEIWLVLFALGASRSFSTPFVVEGFSKVVSGLAYFVPGNIGVAEGGIVLALQAVKLSAATGLALALIRRSRALAWVGVGCLLLLGLGIEKRPAVESEELSPAPEKVLGDLPGR